MSMRKESVDKKCIPLAQMPCFKHGELGNFKANFPNKRVIIKKNNIDYFRGEKTRGELLSNEEDDYRYSILE